MNIADITATMKQIEATTTRRPRAIYVRTEAWTRLRVELEKFTRVTCPEATIPTPLLCGVPIVVSDLFAEPVKILEDDR